MPVQISSKSARTESARRRAKESSHLGAAIASALFWESASERCILNGLTRVGFENGIVAAWVVPNQSLGSLQVGVQRKRALGGGSGSLIDGLLRVVDHVGGVAGVSSRLHIAR